MREPPVCVLPAHEGHLRAVVPPDQLNAALAAVRDAAHVSTTVLAPLAERADAELLFPRAQLQAIFAHRLVPLSLAAAHGGRGMHPLVEAFVFELLASGCAAASLTASVHAAVTHAIAALGTPAQQAMYLPPFVAGDLLGAFALTEPQSGSNAIRMMTTTATPQPGGGWQISGTKVYITSGGEADVYLVFARTPDGPAAFLVPRETPGLRFGPNDLPKLGMRGNRTAQLDFDRCTLPADALLGPSGDGRALARATLGGARLAVAAMCAGIAQTAFTKAELWAGERATPRGAVADIPAVAHKLRRSRRALAQMRALVAAAAVALAAPDAPHAQRQIALLQAKIWCSEVAQDLCNDAIQICAGTAYVQAGNLHRHWRDVRLYTIGEGTTEVLAAELDRLGAPSLWQDTKGWERDLPESDTPFSS